MWITLSQAEKEAFCRLCLVYCSKQVKICWVSNFTVYDYAPRTGPLEKGELLIDRLSCEGEKLANYMPSKGLVSVEKDNQ